MLLDKSINKIPHIVLAEDDANECMLFKDALKSMQLPFVCSFANNGETLLTMLEEQDFNPDLILLDLHKPGKTGKDWLEALKSKKKLNRVPIILYSGSANPKDRDYCYNTKPYEYFLTALDFLL